MDIFITGFWILLAICGLLYFYTRTTLPSSNDAAFSAFQRTYLCVYLLAMAADWMQGPYVYALYDHYGMSTHDIEVLFVVGFGSSMMVGTFVGSFADKYGRRNNAIIYGILYMMSCVTKHFNNYWILMVGRLLGGVATSILYSAFESWLVYEHNKRGFDSDLLGTVFSHAVLGNSIVAIFSGLVAQQFATHFGFVAPFDVSMCLLMTMIIVMVFTWVENHGDTVSSPCQSLGAAFTAIRTDRKILCLGLIQSLFEGSMYTFVLEWTPALTPPRDTHKSRLLLADASSDTPTIPHGYIFAAFMVAVMTGSTLFKLLNKYLVVESFMRPVLLSAAVALLMPVLFPGNQLIVFIGFLVFETCVGIFWPSIGFMRGKYIPEASRATIMNFFRVPLNLIVVVILTQNLSMGVIFKCCAVFLFIASCCQHWLLTLVNKMNAAAKASLPTVSADSKEKKPLPADEERETLMAEKA